MQYISIASHVHGVLHQTFQINMLIGCLFQVPVNVNTRPPPLKHFKWPSTPTHFELLPPTPIILNGTAFHLTHFGTKFHLKTQTVSDLMHFFSGTRQV